MSDVDPNTTILVGKDVPINDISETLIQHNCNHFVQEDNPDFYYDILASVLFLRQPQDILKNPKPLLIASLRGIPEQDEESRSQTFPFSAYSDKTRILKELRRFLEDSDKTSSVIPHVLVLADELLSYSLFTAPKMSGMTTESKGKFFALHDKERLIVGCQDNFGIYDRDGFLGNLNAASQMQSGVMISSDQPEVVSLKLILENSSSIYLLVNPGVKSIITCAVPLGVGYGKLRDTAKNIHMSFTD